LITFYTYIACFRDDTIQSIGVTTDLKRRSKLLQQIGSKKVKKCCKLVYYEEFQSSLEATNRENELNYLTEKALRILVKNTNPMFIDLLKGIKKFD